jgi:hypothetical protein
MLVMSPALPMSSLSGIMQAARCGLVYRIDAKLNGNCFVTP